MKGPVLGVRRQELPAVRPSRGGGVARRRRGLAGGRSDDEEAVVVDVRELVDGQNVRVGLSNPRYLKGI